MSETPQTGKRRNPGLWVQSLYFTQGFPYTTVVEMSSVFFKSMGASLPALGIFQGLFGLPWAFKFIWSPLVELFGTKRRWIVIMQGLLAAALIALTAAVALPGASKIITSQIPMLNLADNWANAGFTVGILLLLFSVGFSLDPRRPAATRAVFGILAALVIAGAFAFHTRLFVSQSLELSANLWFAFAVFMIIAIFSATQDIAIDGFYLDALDPKSQAVYSGVRIMFYRIAMVFGSGLLMMIAGKTTWALGFGIGAAAFLALFLFHTAYLPVIARPALELASGGRRSFAGAFTSFLDQKRIVFILLFLLLFRIDDMFWKPMSKPFLMDIGVTVQQLGLIQGILGLCATILGGILGGIFVAKKGLTKSLWVLGIIHGCNVLVYSFMAHIFPVLPKGETLARSGLVIVAACNIFENLAIGLGTTAFVNFIMRTCKKEYTAAHYAIATGLFALSGMLANFFSGFLVVELNARTGGHGYFWYFLFCFVVALPGLVILAFLPLKDLEARAAAEAMAS